MPVILSHKMKQNQYVVVKMSNIQKYWGKYCRPGHSSRISGSLSLKLYKISPKQCHWSISLCNSMPGFWPPWAYIFQLSTWQSKISSDWRLYIKMWVFPYFEYPCIRTSPPNSVLVRLGKPIQLKRGTFTIYQNSESPMFQFYWLP